MKVKCPECYKVFNLSDSRKYVHCSHCEAELDRETLEIIPENKNQQKESIFSKALKKMEENKNLILVLLLLTALNQSLKAMTAQEITQKLETTMRGDTAQATYQMTIINPNWTRTLSMQTWSESDMKFFIIVLSPPKEKGITYLKIGYEMWNYLPSVERTIKIPPSMMLQSWMGSDFTNDDLVKETSLVRDYEQNLLGTEKVGERNAYKIELKAKPNAPVTWGKVIVWVDTTAFVPLREEFFSEKNELINVLTYENFKQLPDRLFPTRWVMTPQKKPGHQTLIELTNISFNTPNPSNIFSLQSLKARSR